MANKQKVDELKAELSKRGLVTSGTKAVLIRRLESAVRKENESSIDIAEATAGKKRLRESGVVDSNGSVKIKAVESLRNMGIRQLREEARREGVSPSGSKRELLERLCRGSEEVLSEISEGNKEDKKENASQKKKQVTCTKKGTAVVDEYLPDDLKTQYHVLHDGEEIYAAKLKQRNAGKKNDQFYAIQVLESNDGDKFIVYHRWGQVGAKGKDKVQGPYISRDLAIREFELKFMGKTNNHWCKRKQFICHPSYYTWLEIDDNKTEESDVSQSCVVSS